MSAEIIRMMGVFEFTCKDYASGTMRVSLTMWANYTRTRGIRLRSPSQRHCVMRRGRLRSSHVPLSITARGALRAHTRLQFASAPP